MNAIKENAALGRHGGESSQHSDFTMVPVEMREQIASWILWRYTQDHKKLPDDWTHTPGAKYKGAPNPALHMSYPAALAKLHTRMRSGLAVYLPDAGVQVTMADGHSGFLYCFDLDGMYGSDADGPCWEPAALDLWELTGRTYAEVSPSGTGLKLFMVCDVPPTGKSIYSFGSSTFSVANPDVSKYQEMLVEVFSKGFFLTITGCDAVGTLQYINAARFMKIVQFLDARGTRKAMGTVSSLAPLGFDVPAYIQQLSARADETVLNIMGRPPAETAANVDIVKSYLSVLDAGCSRDPWIKVIFSVAAHGFGCGESLARDWSMTAPDSYTEAGFNTAWASFNPDKASYMTLRNMALDAGWKPPVMAVPNGSTAPSLSSVPAKSTPSASVNGAPTKLRETDEGFAEHVAVTYANYIRFVAEHNAWVAFDGRSWVFEYGIATAKDCAKKEARAYHAQKAALQPADDAGEDARKKSLAFAYGMENGKKLENIVSKMQADPRLITSVGLFDDKPYLVNLVNGTYDLKRDEMRAHEPADYLTQRVNITRDPNAQCPRWLQFMDEVTCGNKELATFLQCIAGLCLSGDVTRHEAYFFWGKGSNGKSVFTTVIRQLCGDYYKPLDIDVLMHSNKSGQSNTGLASLRGARAVSTSELPRGVQLKSNAFKDLTGGDALQVDDKYVKAFTLKPQCTILIPTNFMPTIVENDNGTWRRCCIIPFSATFDDETKDARLGDKLAGELQGILNWAIDGFRLFRAGKMTVPTVVRELTAKYRDDLNLTGKFVSQYLIEDVAGRTDQGRIKLDDLYAVYQVFCKAEGLRAGLTKRMFKEDIGEYLTVQTINSRQPVYWGWRIRKEYVTADLMARFVNQAHKAKSLHMSDDPDD